MLYLSSPNNLPLVSLQIQNVPTVPKLLGQFSHGILVLPGIAHREVL